MLCSPLLPGSSTEFTKRLISSSSGSGQSGSQAQAKAQAVQFQDTASGTSELSWLALFQWVGCIAPLLIVGRVITTLSYPCSAGCFPSLPASPCLISQALHSLLAHPSGLDWKGSIPQISLLLVSVMGMMDRAGGSLFDVDYEQKPISRGFSIRRIHHEE